MSKIKLSELGSLKNGLNFNSGNIIYGGCKIIGIPDFADRYIADLRCLSEVDSAIVNEDYLLRKDDILFVRSNGNKALVGRTMIIGEVKERITYSGFCIRFRPDKDKVLPLFLLYLFKSPQFRKQFSKSQQTSINNLNQDTLGSIIFDLPDIHTQEMIVKCIHSITQKIETNKAVNDNLQQMSVATYMHLFYSKKYNGRLGDILVENAKSTIQVGKAKDKFGGYPFFTSGDAVLRWIEPIVEGRNTFLNTGGNADVKFYVGATAYSTDTWCVTAKDGMEDYLYLLLSSIKQELNLKFFQGTGLKHLQKPLLKDKAIYIPSKEEISSFNADVKPWLSMISDNTRESYRLSALRDWLLPMLMNGQATISD